jgi:hypothetical protein
MKKAFCTIFSIVAALATLGAAPELALALTRPGFAGAPALNSDAASFSYGASVTGGHYGLGLRNTSDSVKAWVYDLSVDTKRTYDIVVRVIEDGTMAGWVSCWTIVAGANGQAIAGGSSATSSNVTGYQNLALTTPVIPEDGILYVACNITGNSTAKVFSVAWY